MKTKLAAFARDHLTPGDQVIVAVSGGRDSMALLHGLRAISGEFDLTVSAAHFNHQLRGAEADRDADFVRTYCEGNGISMHSGRGDVAGYAAEHGMGLEEAARSLRYAFLLSLSPRAKIATAHTAEDNLETVLMHLIRGSGLRGLTGIPPVRDRIIRPMLEVTRPEIEAYLSAHQIPHVEDSTNAGDNYLRNRIRHQVLPVLEAENPQAAMHASALSKTLRAEDAYMNTRAEAALAGIQQDGRLDRKAFFGLHEALQDRVLTLFLACVPELRRAHLTAARTLMQSASPSGVLDLPGGWQLRRIYDRMELEAPVQSSAAPLPAELFPGQTVRFGPWLVRCETDVCGQSPEPGTFYLRSEGISWPLTLRSRQPGDRIRLSGGTKKLSDLMIDEKIPAHLRDELPVVCAGTEVAAVLPLHLSRSFQALTGQDSVKLSAIRMEDESCIQIWNMSC